MREGAGRLPNQREERVCGRTRPITSRAKTSGPQDLKAHMGEIKPESARNPYATPGRRARSCRQCMNEARSQTVELLSRGNGNERRTQAAQRRSGHEPRILARWARQPGG